MKDTSTIGSYSYPDEVARKWKQERDLLREALECLWMHIDSGNLCRDTSKDHNDDWMIMCSALVTDLKRAKDALDLTK